MPNKSINENRKKLHNFEECGLVYLYFNFKLKKLFYFFLHLKLPFGLINDEARWVWLRVCNLAIPKWLICVWSGLSKCYWNSGNSGTPPVSRRNARRFTIAKCRLADFYFTSPLSGGWHSILITSQFTTWLHDDFHFPYSFMYSYHFIFDSITLSPSINLIMKFTAYTRNRNKSAVRGRKAVKFPFIPSVGWFGVSDVGEGETFVWKWVRLRDAIVLRIIIVCLLFCQSLLATLWTEE